jgi:hypothetical protein
MRKLFTLMILLISSLIVSGQTLIRDSTDILKQGETKIYIRKPWAFQFDFGAAYFLYDIKTIEWIGNHRGFVFGFELERERIFLMINARLFTVNPKKELSFNDITLPIDAKLNPIRTDLVVGYKYDLLRKVTINSYIGWMNSSFYVINEKDLGRTFQIPSKSGFTIGTGFNYYLEFEPYVYSILFLNYNFNLSNYSKINSSLGNTFQSFEFGVAFKFWTRKIKTVNQKESPYWPL